MHLALHGTAPPVLPRPQLRSYDSGEECSLDHWFALCCLVEEENSLARESESELSLLSWD